MPDDNPLCELSDYIDNDYICKVTGEVCSSTPNGTPDRNECFTYFITNKEDYGG